MFKKRFSKFRPKRFRKKSSVKKVIRKARNTAFKKRVLSVIHRQAEKKHVATSAINNIINDTPSTSYIYQILPNMSVGTGDANRIGDEVRARSFKLKMLLDHAPPVTANSSAHTYYGIRVMIVQPRQFRGLSQIQTNADTWLSNLFRDGATKTGWSSASAKSMMLPINTEEIIVYHDKSYYENFNTVIQSTTAPTTFIYSMNQTEHGHKELVMHIKCANKALKYDSSVNSGLTPVNFNPVLLVGICNLNGVTLTSSNMNLSWFSELTYEDI